MVVPLMLISCGKSAPRRPTGAESKPAMQDILLIERSVAKLPCVGPLDRWERLYAFGGPLRALRENEIEFTYREAGKYSFKAGRRVMRVADWYNLDDRPYRMVTGRLDRTTRRLTIDYCGPNTAEPMPEARASGDTKVRP